MSDFPIFPCAHQWTTYGQVPWVYFRVYFSVIHKVLSAFSSAFIQPAPPQRVRTLCSLFCDFSLSKKMPVPTPDIWLFIFRLLAILCLDVFYPTVLSGGINCSKSLAFRGWLGRVVFSATLYITALQAVWPLICGQTSAKWCLRFMLCVKHCALTVHSHRFHNGLIV